MKKIPHKKMIIKDLTIFARLGLTKEEQSSEQEIRWTIEYHLKSSTEKDFICYESLSQKLTAYSKNNSFSLMESMVIFCFQKLKQDFPQIESLRLCLHKVNPPIQNVKGGVIYEYGDF